MRISALKWMRWLCTTAFVAGQGNALAGAWTMAEDQTLVILSASYEVAPVSSLFYGIPDRDEASGQVFLEHGLFEDLTLGFKAFSKVSPLTGENDTRLGLHARQRLWQGWNGSVVSVQAGFELSASEWMGQMRPSDSVFEIDARALYGKGWQWDWANSFVSTELGYRHRRGDEVDEFRFDGTIGLEPWDGFLGLITVAGAVPFGREGTTSLDVTPSLAFTLWPSVGDNDKKPDLSSPPIVLQIGLGVDVIDLDQGAKITFGLWRRF